MVPNWLGILQGQEEASVDWLSVQQYERITKQQNLSFPFIQTNNNGEDLYYNFSSPSSKLENIGVLDMGGYSTEISFSPSQISLPKDSHAFQNITFMSENNLLYSVSYDGLGHNAADASHESFIIQKNYQLGDFSNRYFDPCFPKNSSFYAKSDASNGNLIILDGKSFFSYFFTPMNAFGKAFCFPHNHATLKCVATNFGPLVLRCFFLLLHNAAQRQSDKLMNILILNLLILLFRYWRSFKL